MKHFTFQITLAIGFLVALVSADDPPNKKTSEEIQPGEMSGYLIVPHEKVPETYNAGFSLYVAAWPLLRDYPGSQFQTGLNQMRTPLIPASQCSVVSIS